MGSGDPGPLGPRSQGLLQRRPGRPVLRGLPECCDLAPVNASSLHICKIVVMSAFPPPEVVVKIKWS